MDKPLLEPSFFKLNILVFKSKIEGSKITAGKKRAFLIDIFKS